MTTFSLPPRIRIDLAITGMLSRFASPRSSIIPPHETIALEMFQYVYNLQDLRTITAAVNLFVYFILTPQWAFSTIRVLHSPVARTRRKTRRMSIITDMQDYSTDTGTGGRVHQTRQKQSEETKHEDDQSVSELEDSLSDFLEGLAAFFTFDSFFSFGPSLLAAFFGFSGESFHRTLTADMASLAVFPGLASLHKGSCAFTKRLYGLGAFFDFGSASFFVLFSVVALRAVLVLVSVCDLPISRCP